MSIFQLKYKKYRYAFGSDKFFEVINNSTKKRIAWISLNVSDGKKLITIPKLSLPFSNADLCKKIVEVFIREISKINPYDIELELPKTHKGIVRCLKKSKFREIPQTSKNKLNQIKLKFKNPHNKIPIISGKPKKGDWVEIAIKPYKGKTEIGIVKDVLTKKKVHPRGHKVRLKSGTIGRILKILEFPKI